jgi:hypothetical protein
VGGAAFEENDIYFFSLPRPGLFGGMGAQKLRDNLVSTVKIFF